MDIKDHSWRRFVCWFFGTMAGACIAVALFVFLVDPYGAFSLSPRWGHGAGRLHLPGGWVQEQRYIVPLLARNPEFDSAIIGNSTCQPFAPATLNAAFGGRFANLCMGGATQGEQLLVLEAFSLNRAPRTIVVSLYVDVCAMRHDKGYHPRVSLPEGLYRPGLRTFRFLVETEALMQALYLARVNYGWTSPATPQLPDSYYRDGDWDIYANRDLSPSATSQRIYSGRLRVNRHLYDKAKIIPVFPRIDDIADALAALPSSTRKVLIFMPVHPDIAPAPGTPTEQRTADCRAKLSELARIPGLTFADYFTHPLVQDDANFFDAAHVHRSTSDRMIKEIADRLKLHAGPHAHYDESVVPIKAPHTGLATAITR